MATPDCNGLAFVGYGSQTGVVSLTDAAGRPTQVHIRELAASKDLLSQLSPDVAFTLGNWHADFMERRFAVSALI
jgi:hypothetical protein